MRLADVLAAAGLEPGATDVDFAAPDVAGEADPPQPYGGSIPAGLVLLALAGLVLVVLKGAS